MNNIDTLFNIGLLFIATPEGIVFPSEKPGYRLEFHDVTYISDGIGRFEGATGELQPNGFAGESQTDHMWEGTLILAQNQLKSLIDHPDKWATALCELLNKGRGYFSSLKILV